VPGLPGSGFLRLEIGGTLEVGSTPVGDLSPVAPSSGLVDSLATSGETLCGLKVEASRDIRDCAGKVASLLRDCQSDVAAYDAGELSAFDYVSSSERLSESLASAISDLVESQSRLVVRAGEAVSA